MKISILCILSILCLNSASSQESIFDDTFLSNYEIILLGEQTHGDGAVFEKKLEMVKELHEKGGFNLLVFESGMYDNFKANQLYNTQKEDISIFKESVGWLYTDTQVFQDLLSYIETHPELKILGFDSQESTIFETYFLDDFKALCTRNNISISEEDYTLLDKNLIVGDVESYINNKKDSTALYTKIHEIQDRIDLIPKNDLETKMLIQTFKSAFSDMDYSLKYHQKEKSHVQNPRDKQMAENLTFLKETYANEKFIGWGASFHFANRLNEFEYTPITESYLKKGVSISDSLANHIPNRLEEEVEQLKDLNFAIPMGQILKQKYGEKLFSLAFTSYEGYYRDYTQNLTHPIQKPPTNSYEYNFKKQSSSEQLQILNETDGKLYASVLGYIPLYGNWNNIFDGIYYIETMFPPTYLNQNFTKETLAISNDLKNYEGIIIDDETEQPIPYADIYYSKSNQSTVSDTGGKFFITNSNISANQLIFSSLSYVNDSIQIQELKKSNIIRLKKSKEDILLNEVVVMAKYKELSAEEIIKKARKHVVDNYVQTPYNQTFHYSVKEFDSKDSIYNGEEALIHTFNKKGINGSNKVENGLFGEIQHLRNNTDKYDNRDYGWRGVGGLWATMNRDIILSKTNILYRTSSYDLIKKGTTNYNGRKVYRIDFVNNSPGVYSTGYGYPAPVASNGHIYIDVENYAILKYEHCINRGSYKSKKSINNVKGSIKISQSYKKLENQYFMNLLEVINTAKVYSPDNTYLNTVIHVNKLVSNNIETKNVSVIKRRLLDLKKEFKTNTNDTFWNDKPLDFKIKIPKAEVCGGK